VRIPVAAEYDQQVTHHRGLALLVEREQRLVGQQRERHFNHADGALDDPLPRGDDGACWRCSIDAAISGA
jgi:hypothetical protein